MAEYLLIESRDPYTDASVPQSYELAAGLARAGNTVTLFLVENGVFAARKSPAAEGLSTIAADGVEVLADEFALAERGIVLDRVQTGVRAAALDVVVDYMGAGRKTIWH